MSFIQELWDSVFTPGTSPALIKATHASFVLLILSLITLIFMTRSIHFINLLVISVCLYAAVIWFIEELKKAKLKSNEELATEGDLSPDSTQPEKSGQEEKKGEESKANSTGKETRKTPLKRKA